MFQQVALMNAFSNRKTAMVGWSVGLAGFVGLQMFSDQNDCLKLYVRGDRLTFRNNRITIFFQRKIVSIKNIKAKQRPTFVTFWVMSAISVSFQRFSFVVSYLSLKDFLFFVLNWGLSERKVHLFLLEVFD